MQFKKLIASIKQNSFIRSASILVSGAAFAHVITAVALPVLTRLYSPSDFSVLAVFSSLIAIIVVAACLRFDVAIPLPKSDVDAINLLVLSLLCAGVISIIVFITVLLAPHFIARLLNQPELTKYLWLLPISIFLGAAYTALQAWFIRQKKFLLIAHSRIAQSAACAAAQLGLAGLASGPAGLLIGYLMNSGIACFSLGYSLYKHRDYFQHYKNALNCSTLRRTWYEYRKFPQYSTLEALANSASIQVPIILISSLAIGPEAGYLLLAMTVIQAPMALFGNAIGQVYLSRAPDEFRSGRMEVFTKDILIGLIKAGIFPLLLFGIFSPLVFALVFGSEWGRAGWLVTWMTPWFMLQFITAPISMALHITGHQKLALILQLSGLVFRIFIVWITGQFLNEKISEAYAISGALFYFGYLMMVLRCVKST